MKHDKSYNGQRGQSSIEYLIVCGALVFALGLGMVNDDSSVLLLLLHAFATAYQKISYALSIPM